MISLLPVHLPLRSTGTVINKARNESCAPARKRDPALHNSPSSFRKKQDIIGEIEESARTLGLSRSDTSLVFYRSTVEDQITVTKKALAYVELLITSYNHSLPD
jgi:hypothetical protein